MKYFYYAPMLFAAVLAAPGAQADVCINEIMQSNVDCVFVDNDYPDSWVELYNSGSADADISGYRIGVKEKLEKCYGIPQGTIVPAGGYLMVYCDKEDRGLHTDFRLESGKGIVVLYDADGHSVDKVDHAKMPAPDVAYGRLSDGGAEWGYFVKPTPGVANAGATSALLLPAPVFSLPSAMMTSPAQLHITLPEDCPEGARLCVTTDGSEPCAYDAVDVPYMLDLTKSVVVRAKLVSDNCLSRRSEVRSYIFDTPGADMDVFSLVCDPEDLYDPERGILNGEGEVPNYLSDWRRPVNVEYFHQGEPQFSILGETRVQGGYTRKINPQKSLAVYANKRFGTKRFDSTFFWPSKPGVRECKSFILRNAGNDFNGAHIRDAFLQQIIGTHTDNLDYQAHRPVAVYINGEYRGVYNLRERSNDDFVEANYDGLEDIDMTENWNEQKAGSEEAVKEFIEFYSDPDLTLEALSERFDVDSFLQKLACDIYATNGDFIRNNAVFWRNNLPDADNRWRILVKDLDLGVGRWDPSASINMFDVIDNYMTDEAFENDAQREFIGKLVRLYQFFLEDAEARELLTDRVAFFMGDFFSCDAATEFFNGMLDEFSADMPRTYGVYYKDGELETTIAGWLDHTGNIIPRWLALRGPVVASQMAARFNLGVPYRLHVDPSLAPEPVAIYSRVMTQKKFEGFGFSGRPLSLPAVDGLQWLCVEKSADAESRETVYGTGEAVSYLPVEDMADVSFRLVDPTSVAVPEADGESAPRYWSIDGIRLPAAPTGPGIYIEISGGRVRKIVK